MTDDKLTEALKENICLKGAVRDLIEERDELIVALRQIETGTLYPRDIAKGALMGIEVRQRTQQGVEKDG